MRPMWRPSPNHGPRAGVAGPDMVVLHYTDMTSASDALARLCDPASAVSAHYLITAGGDVIQMVDEGCRAWHAGLSSWDGSSDINSRSVGIELDSPGHRPDAPTFPDRQIATLLDLLGAIRSRWPVPVRNVVAHSDIAPARKIDPGERFPWGRLATAGHALIAVTARVAAPTGLTDGAMAAALLACGYGVDGPGVVDLATAIDGFHRRHRPQMVGRPADLRSLHLALALAAATQADRTAILPRG